MTFTCLRLRWKSVHYLETKDEALLALQFVGLGEDRHLRAGTCGVGCQPQRQFTKQLKLPDFNRLRLTMMSAPPPPAPTVGG